jgi:hypothetical protein
MRKTDFAMRKTDFGVNLPEKYVRGTDFQGLQAAGRSPYEPL